MKNLFWFALKVPAKIHFRYFPPGFAGTFCVQVKKQMSALTMVKAICVSFFSQVDQLNKLASSQCMGLLSSAGTEHCSANAEAMGSNPVEAPKNSFFFQATSQILKLKFNCDGRIFISLVNI